MLFGKTQKIKFASDQGTYSVVTDRECKDSQITATDYEAQLLIDHFGQANIQVGNVGSNLRKAKKDFRLYPGGEKINLNLVYPKPNKSELRLYISSKAGFRPEGERIWFMYVQETDIWIGSMSEIEWRAENKLLIYDESEGIYQDSLQELDTIKVNKMQSRDVFARDRSLALSRMESCKHQCEFNPGHELFTSRSTKLPYLEAHHLLPISLQKSLGQNLDLSENIYCLCPHCHRAIHLAEKSLTRTMIEVLVNKRPEVLDIIDCNLQDVYNFYSVEKIA